MSRSPAGSNHRVALVVVVTLLLAAVGAVAPRPAGAVTTTGVAADGETEPVTSSGDSADDPAIWVHPTDPALSLVIGNDKGTALEVYDLDGKRRQLISEAHGNVDVRRGFPLAGSTVDIVAGARNGITVYRVDPSARLLSDVSDGSIPGSGEGFCLYRSPGSGLFYAFIITRAGHVQQVRLEDGDSDGRIDGTLVRTFEVGGEAEGCVADDDLGRLFISEEDAALWSYGAEPGDSPTDRFPVDTMAPAGHLVPDVEGLTVIATGPGTGYLVASAQNVASPLESYFNMYRRQAPHGYVGSFQIMAGTQADGCSRTDGIDATAEALGPAFPGGLFVCQDDSNTAPGSEGNQNFKFVRLEKILALDSGTPPPPDTTPPDTTITSAAADPTTSTTATFAFHATEPATFACSLDGQAAAPCTSPTSYANLAVGDHTFAVTATDTAGNPDPTPATHQWTITTGPPAPTGIIDTLAGSGTRGSSGDGGPGTAAQLAAPRTTAVAPDGSVVVADTENHRIRRIDTSGVMSTIAGTGARGFSGDGGPATAAQLYNPHGVAVDAAGNVFIGDSPNQRVRRIDAVTGIITTVAGTGSSGYNGDGIAATSAQLNYPKDVTVGPDGSLYIGDANNHRVRRVDAGSGIITTVAGTGTAGFSGDGGPATAARLSRPRAVAFDPDGRMYIADDANCRVRRVGTDGAITTVAGSSSCGYGGDGGPATAALLSSVRDVAVDTGGNLYIADERNHRIRRVDPDGTITTFAGTGSNGYNGDGVPATEASLSGPRGVTVDAAGGVVVGDTGNHRIRRVS